MTPRLPPTLSRLRREFKHALRNWRNAHRKTFRDFSLDDVETIRRVSPYTQTSWQKLHGLLRATEYVATHGIPGAFVECGVWRGGSMMAVAITLLRAGVNDRDLYLFDTFEGMSEPGEVDVDYRGSAARAIWEQSSDGDGGSDWCRANLDEVRRAMESVGYPTQRIHYAAGKVENTIPDQAPEQIALLRLDTDWYESTRHELLHLYPRLTAGGTLIIDDYGTWQGARKAVDEYLLEHRLPLLLNRLDAGARIAVKPR